MAKNFLIIGSGFNALATAHYLKNKNYDVKIIFEKNYPIEKNFPLNVVYDCLNIPVDLFTPLFAMSRCAGWCAHRLEENLSGKRIIRPGYKYVEKN